MKRKFGRETDQRRAFLKSLANNLILKEKIRTTEARAKELRSFVERLISTVAKESLASRRQSARVLTPAAAKKLTQEASTRFKEKKGGYTRLTKIGRRASDGASIVYIELIK
jgi:large subunit ribosomal protein L17